MNVTELIAIVRVSRDRIVPEGALYSIAAATPEEAARLLDAIFRHHFQIRPFPEEQDYAVGAEWL